MFVNGESIGCLHQIYTNNAKGPLCSFNDCPFYTNMQWQSWRGNAIRINYPLLGETGGFPPHRANIRSFDASSGVHYIDVIMTTRASQITSLTVVYSTVYSDTDQSKHQSSASLAFVWGIHRDRWIPRTKGQLRGKCFYLMTSSCIILNRLLNRHDAHVTSL